MMAAIPRTWWDMTPTTRWAALVTIMAQQVASAMVMATRTCKRCVMMPLEQARYPCHKALLLVQAMALCRPMPLATKVLVQKLVAATVAFILVAKDLLMRLEAMTTARVLVRLVERVPHGGLHPMPTTTKIWLCLKPGEAGGGLCPILGMQKGGGPLFLRPLPDFASMGTKQKNAARRALRLRSKPSRADTAFAIGITD